MQGAGGPCEKKLGRIDRIEEDYVAHCPQRSVLLLLRGGKDGWMLKCWDADMLEGKQKAKGWLDD